MLCYNIHAVSVDKLFLLQEAFSNRKKQALTGNISVAYLFIYLSSEVTDTK